MHLYVYLGFSLLKSCLPYWMWYNNWLLVDNVYSPTGWLCFLDVASCCWVKPVAKMVLHQKTWLLADNHGWLQVFVFVSKYLLTARWISAMQTRDDEVKVVAQLLCCSQCVFERRHFYFAGEWSLCPFCVALFKVSVQLRDSVCCFCHLFGEYIFFPSHRRLPRDYRLVCRPVWLKL